MQMSVKPVFQIHKKDMVKLQNNQWINDETKRNGHQGIEEAGKGIAGGHSKYW
jgi:hypothetical protein